MKKIIIVVSVIFILCSNLLAEDFTVDGIVYTITSSTAPYTVEVGINTNYSGDAIIPATVTNETITYAVTSIGERAFYLNSRLSSITLSDGLDSIKYRAFKECNGVTSLVLPNSVTYLADFSISSMEKLESLVLSNSITFMGEGACSWNQILTNVTIPENLTVLSEKAFRYCSTLDSVVIPSTITELPRDIFESCLSLKSVTLSNNLTIIGESAFEECNGLPSIFIPPSVKRIDESAFYNCKSLVDITFSEGLDSIGAYSFTCIGNTEPFSITIPASVSFIGARAFSPYSTFRESYGLSAIYVDESNMNYSSDSIALFNKDKTTLIQFPANYSGNYSIPSTVKEIYRDAFTLVNNLTSVHISSSVNSIFYTPFENCHTLSAITVDENNTMYSSDGYVLFNKDKSELIEYPKAKSGDYTVPETVTSIRSSAFYDCDSVTSVVIPSSVTMIDKHTFYSCNYLSMVTLPETIERLETVAFAECVRLKTINCSSETPPSLGTQVFRDIGYGCKVYVPSEEAVKSYDSIDQWSDLNVVSDSSSVGILDDSHRISSYTTEGYSLKVAPTPTKDDGKLFVSSEENGVAIFTIYTSNGQIVTQMKSEVLDIDETVIEYSAMKNLPPGNYFVKMTLNSEVRAITRLVKIK